MVLYILKRSRRARYMRLTVRPGGEIVLTAPFAVPASAIEGFFTEHRTWIDKSVARMRRFRPLPVRGRRAYLAHKEAAREFITKRVAYWNRGYNFVHGRIAIKNTKRLWGSCSHKGNLNFSYLLLYLPRELADYVVVHELCHLQERNHGPGFWKLVAEALPDYALHRKELRRYLPS